MRLFPHAILMLLVSLVLASESNASDATTLNLDSERSTITFTSDAPGERIVGTASSVSGTLSVDLDNPETASGTMQFPVSGMRTGNRSRDRHLAGREWLNASANPNVTFTLERLSDVTREAEGERVTIRARAHGQVEVNGVSAPAEAQVEVILLMDRRSARIQPTFAIRLADHQVRGARGAIGDTVGETIDIEGLLYASWD